jgi:hypothetical protein
MEWFVQTPEYSFKDTLGHSTVLVVFSPGGYHPEYRAGLQDPFSSGVVRLRRMTFQECVRANTFPYSDNNFSRHNII